MHQFVGGALKIDDTLALADLHVGYAAQLRADGVHVPTDESNQLLARIDALLTSQTPKRVIINGDLKHAFGTISDDEWRTIKQLVARIQEDAQLILVKGNHDPLLEVIADEVGLDAHTSYQEAGTLYIHGDKEPTTLEGITRIVIGHQHPAIRIGTSVRTELCKCYLHGTYKQRELIVLPSFFDLTPGSDVLQEDLISPLLDDISDFQVHAIVGEDVLEFGTVSDVAAMRDETL